MDPLKDLLAEKKMQIKDFKSDKKELNKRKKEPGVVGKIVKIDNQISKLEDFVKRFSPSKMEPVQIEDIVINYKLYTQFIKKLKGFFITEEIIDGALVLKYYKGNHKGELKLLDLTHFFLEGSEFVKGELYGES